MLFRKVLIDGESALNLLFAGALKELGLKIGDLAPSDSVIVVVVQLFSLELLSQAEVVRHLMLAIFVERARAFENLLVLIIVVALSARFINGGDDVVWSAAVILTRFGPFEPVTATVTMMIVVVVAAVTVALVVGSLVAAES